MCNDCEFFARHRKANIVMVVMIVTGIISADRLNRQFFPDVDGNCGCFSVENLGATAEDVDSNIVKLLEPELLANCQCQKSLFKFL